MVVLSHALLSGVSQVDDSFALRIICSFQMPLFMFISGVATRISFNRNEKLCVGGGYIKKKALALLIPFFVWIFVPYIFISHTFPLTDVYKHLIDVMKFPDRALWFLLVLFVINLLFVCMYNINKKFKIPLVILTCLFFYIIKFITKYLEFDYLGFPLIKTHIRYFMAGYIIYGIHAKFLCEKYKKIEYVLLAFMSICFIFTARFWYWSSPPSFSAFECVQQLPYFFRKLLVFIFENLLPYCGIALSLLISVLIAKIKFLSFVLAIIGTNTLEIYAMHLYGFNFVNAFENSFVGIVCDVLIGIMFSIVTAYFVRGSVLSSLLFGKRYYPNKKSI